MPTRIKRKPFNERSADEHWASAANYMEWSEFIMKIAVFVALLALVVSIVKAVR